MHARWGVAAAMVAGLVVVSGAPAGADAPPWPPPAPAPPFQVINPGSSSTPAPAAPAPLPAVAGAPVAVNTVAGLQQRLKQLAYDPGPVDGEFGPMTRFAVIAFQKVQGLRLSGVADASVYAALASPKAPPVLAAGAGADRIEIDLGRQLLMAYRGGALALISHISSGTGRHYCEAGHCGTAITPTGTFHVLWFRPGWDTSPLGLLYNAEYFTTAGHAVHGSMSVPLYPASHGCVRIPMHTAQWFPSIVTKGEPVVVS